MSPEQLALVSALCTLLGGGGIFGIWKFIIDRKKAPLEARQVIVATESQQIADALAMATASDARAIQADNRATQADERAAAAYREATEARAEARVDREEAKSARVENTETRRIAEEALAQAHEAKRRSEKSELKLDRFIHWFHNDIVGDWDTVRQSPTPPALPHELNTGPIRKVE